MPDSPTPKLDYEIPKRRQLIRLPPDWPRRLKIAAVAAPLVFLLTFEVARHSQSSAIAYMSGGIVNIHIHNLQKDVDAYVRSTRQTPTNLWDIPAIRDAAAKNPSLLIDPWRNAYQLQLINGKPTVLSYGEDAAPGGKGLDADITTATPHGSQLPTYPQFIRHTRLIPLLFICFANAVMITFLTFSGETDTRQKPHGLLKLILSMTLISLMSIVIAGIIAALHAPSGH